jgi:endo-1,4-beta-xylanase
MQQIMVFLLLICIVGLLPQRLYSQLPKNKDKFLGGSSSAYIFRDFGKYLNQLTPGNNGKWGMVTSTRGQYNWTTLDNIYNTSIARGFIYKHHVLVWGSQQPVWIAGLDSANQRAEVEDWIRQVGQRYPKMPFIEVVNEPFNTPLPVYKDALGGDGITGWDWVITAFQLARKYCAPSVKLILNEYNVLHNNDVTTSYINLINLLKDRGLIDGIGVQGHYFEFRSEINSPTNHYVWDTTTIKNNLNRLTATGLPVYITEFDIDEQDDSNQLSQYKIYFPIFWNNPGVKGITFWGFIQYDIWTAHPYTYLLLSDESTERPALKWLRTYLSPPPIPVTISPSSSASGVPRNPTLVWYSSNNAKSYHIQVSTNSDFPSAIVDTTITDTLLTLRPLNANSRYYWRVSALNNNGTSEYSVTADFTTGEKIVDVKELDGIPKEFKLSQNFPNPFNPTTTIKFSLPVKSNVTLSLINTLGQVVKVITSGNFEAGNHEVTLDANRLSSGVYFYKLSTGDYSDIKKLVLMK